MYEMSGKTQIYVYLLEEGTDVWRPVHAVDLGNSIFRILSVNEDPEDEEWEFSTGDAVYCEPRLLGGSGGPHECLVAVRKVETNADPTGST